MRHCKGYSVACHHAHLFSRSLVVTPARRTQHMPDMSLEFSTVIQSCACMHTSTTGSKTSLRWCTIVFGPSSDGASTGAFECDVFCCCLFVGGGRALYISYAHLVYRATHTRDTFDSHRFLSPFLQISFLTHARSDSVCYCRR